MVNVPRSKCILWVIIVVAVILNGVDTAVVVIMSESTLVTVIYGCVL